MHLRFYPLALALALALPVAAHASSANAEPSSTAFRRAPQLARGINLSGWFASSSDLSAAHIARQTTPADLKFIHDAGFTYVRVGFDPVQFTRNGLNSADSQAALARLDKAVDQILAANLSVSLCLFPTDEYKHGLASDRGVQDFLFLWRALALHYAKADPEHVFFEVINEPEVSDPSRWDGIQASAVAVIREAAPAHTIIGTASFYSGMQELLRVHPVRDTNVIYTFHFYEPFPFTHQGATWGSFEWNFYKDVPYPATPDTLRTAMANVPDASARYVLYLYGASGLNASTLLQRLAFARSWADEHHVPIICNEFGAYRDRAPRDSRMRWIRDVRSDLEQLQIGWAMWDYSGNFGLVTRSSDGRIVPEADTLDALGLH